jgi:hypothetical protein
LTLVGSNPAPSIGFLFVGLPPAVLPTAWVGDLLVEPQFFGSLSVSPGATSMESPINHIENSEGASAYLQLL